MVFASPAPGRHPIHEPGGRPNLIWIVFWVDPKEFGSQISIAITAILTLIAYRFAIGANLLNAEYMKHLYLFILGRAIQALASLAQVVTTSSLTKSDRLFNAHRIDSWCRWIFPTILILFSIETLVLRVVL